MATGDKYFNTIAKRLAGTVDFRDRIVGYLRNRSIETNQMTYTNPLFMNDGVTISADGNDKIQIDKDSSDVLGTDGQGHFFDIAEAENDDLQFENTNTIIYYVGLKHCTRPQGIQINPRTGYPEYIELEDYIGEKSNPDAVVDNGDGTITFTITSVTESGVTNAGRQCMVYMVNPVQGATTEAVAIETVTVAYTGGLNKITTTAAFGQTTVSTTTTDYEVILLGPTIKRNTDLRVTSGYCFVGTVTGAGAGNPPTVFSVTDQKVLDYSWSSMLIDGLPQNLFPATDSTYTLGTASLKWSNIYTDALTISGNLTVTCSTNDGSTDGLLIKDSGSNNIFNVDSNGVFFFAETTTPTARTNHGALYTKTDGNLYFQNGAGNENTVSGQRIAFARNFDATNRYVQENRNGEYIGFGGLTNDSISSSDFTFTADDEGIITSFSDEGGGQTRVNATAHGLSAGQVVTLKGSDGQGTATPYPGVFVIDSVDTNYFIINTAYVSSATGVWLRPSQFKANSNAAGIYHVESILDIGGNVVDGSPEFVFYTDETKQTSTSYINDNVLSRHFMTVEGYITISADDVITLMYISEETSTWGDIDWIGTLHLKQIS